ENTSRGELSIIDGETIAMIQEVGIHVSTALSDSVKISIRPEDVILSKGTFTSSARNMHKGKITAVSTKEGVSKVTLDIGIPLVALITEKSYQEMELAIGTELYAIFKTMAVKVF
ncbi:MAG: TOBE domain-containing protein, partial [Anaerovoracaceae bacterium]